MATPPHELPRNALFEAAAAGDIPTIAAYFAQRHVEDEVSETNAFFITHAPSPLHPQGPRAIPWFHERAIQRGFTLNGFLFGIAIENQQLEVLQWFFTSPERVETMGATLALLMPAIGHCAMVTGDFGVDVIEMLLTSRVYQDCLGTEQKMHLLNRFVISAARGPVMLPLLIAHGASVNYTDGGRFVEPLVSITVHDRFGFRRSNRDLNHVCTLVDHGAFVVGSHALSKGSYVVDPRAATRLVEMGADWRGNDTREVLLDMALVGRLLSVRIPIEHGFADVDLQDEDGRTLMIMLMSRKQYSFRTDDDVNILRLLLDHGANIHLRDASGRTALHYAVARHRIREVKLLLEIGADANVPAIDGTTPTDNGLQLLENRNLGGWGILEDLLQHGEDPFTTRNGGPSVYELLRNSEIHAQLFQSRQ